MEINSLSSCRTDQSKLKKRKRLTVKEKERKGKERKKKEEKGKERKVIK